LISNIKLKTGNILEIAESCAEFFNSKKAVNTVFLDLHEINVYLGAFLITTGNSQVHCSSMARDISKFLLSGGIKLRNKPDLNSGWIILDFDNIIIHIFTEELRDYYQLEKLWADGERVDFKTSESPAMDSSLSM